MSATKREKPKKPYLGYPLFPHASGQWARKIRGRLQYFGRWADPVAALEEHNRQYPFLKDGRTPPPRGSEAGCQMRHLCNEYLKSKRFKMAAHELSPSTWKDSHRACKELVEFFGRDRFVDDLGPSDWRDFRSALVKQGISPVTLHNKISGARAVINFGVRNYLLKQAARFGTEFERPGPKVLKKDRDAAGHRLFTRDEVLAILGACKKPQLKAMALLGINCAFGNTDCGSLPESALDLEKGWVEFPRPKTGVDRRIPLWKETVEALREAVRVRPFAEEPRDRKLVFITKYAMPWTRQRILERDGKTTVVCNDGITREFHKILQALKINGRRGLNFYSFRHTFETVGGECRDQVAVDAIMGHKDRSMASNYRHGISDDRLRAVTDVVHGWLFGRGGQP